MPATCPASPIARATFWVSQGLLAICQVVEASFRQLESIARVWLLFTPWVVKPLPQGAMGGCAHWNLVSAVVGNPSQLQACSTPLCSPQQHPCSNEVLISHQPSSFCRASSTARMCLV